MILVCDLEANGLLGEADQIHCAVAKELGKDRWYEFTPENISELPNLLSSCRRWINHNVVAYDEPLLRMLTGTAVPIERLVDTLVVSRLLNPDRARPKGLPQRVGPHSLEAWGVRLGFSKGEYGKAEGAFDEYSPEMLQYCRRDVELTEKVYLSLVEEIKES